MFKQIQSNDIANTLKALEKNEFNDEDLENVFEGLKTKTEILFDSLKQEAV